MAYDLALLRKIANEGCIKAYRNRNTITGSVNWGDLTCVSAEIYHTDSRGEGYRVLIEEADPDNMELQYFIQDHLEERGFEVIEVVTEW